MLMQQTPGVAQLVSEVANDLEHADVGSVAEVHGWSFVLWGIPIQRWKPWRGRENALIVVLDEEDIGAIASTLGVRDFQQLKLLLWKPLIVPAMHRSLEIVE